MQKHTALFICRYLTRAFTEEIISSSPNNRWNGIHIVIKSYFNSYAFKKFRLQTFYWSLSYIIDGIIKKKRLQKK